MDTYLFIALLVFIILLLITLILLFYSNFKQRKFLKKEIINNKERESQDILALKNDLNKELLVFQNQISQSFKDDLNMLNRNTYSSINDFSKVMNEGLNKGFEKTNQAFNEMSKQLVSIDKTQENLSSLSNDIKSLQNVLLDKKTRGVYGEIELYSILKSVYGLNENIYQKQYKLSNNSIADAVIFAPKPLNKIAVDSKFPLENYLKMNDKELSKAENQLYKKKFKQDLSRHINDIRKKYIIKNETADIAFMFVPAEAIFSDIYAQFQDIIDLSYKSNVYLVSPTTLMAYITAIKAIYLGQKQNEKVDVIQEEYKRLANEFERFEKRFTSVIASFERTYKDINNVNITSKKIISRFKDIEAVDLKDSEGN